MTIDDPAPPDRVVTHHGTAAHLHALAMPTVDTDVGARLWLMRPSGPAVVRGSSQKPEIFDAEYLRANDVALVGRRSGGAAVWIEPAGVVWIDVLAPRTSGLWSDELAETFLRVGRCWQRAFARMGVVADVVEHRPERGGPGDLACWAGHGWGEVVIDGVKLVGLSQRRTRWGARVQCMAVIDGSAAEIARAFANISAAQRGELRDAIGTPPSTAVGALDLDAVERAAIEELLAEL